MSYKAVMIEELDQMARDFINGEVEPKKIIGLSLFDMWAVLTLASNYSLAKMGTISPEACAGFKFHILGQYEQFKTRTVFFEKMYADWINRTRDYSAKRTELTKLLADDDADVIELLVLSMQIIDLLTKEDIYLKLFQRKCTDKMFMPHAMQTASKSIDEYREKLGDQLPYAKLIERFYAATCEDKIAELFDQIDPEKFREIARKAIPVKKDIYKKIAESINRMYCKHK